ncbi:CBS domain pair protein [Synechococcus sp. PCC 7335]|uniref:CBS domain-containing protein n=1 Tax=Synechococcus sp. (strain ATCC 29403 / PCC 7335) TaxID=91464 RepID=UPI00017ED652|nr:CBS domain-containing protein [Synechococcus sp. PCC 7335]EDX83542.1 CBS domain pair protein [Synechococcus sp. PCC 7335]
MKVSDIMTTDVVTIRSSATVAKAATLMRQKGVHALVVERTDELDAYGIVAIGDIVGQVIAFGRDPNQIRVYEIMSKPCVVLNPSLRVEYAARLLTQSNLHSAPVIQSELLGILSVSDILERGSSIENPRELLLVGEIEALSEAAELVCEDKGPNSTACAQAWARVDALQAELAHQHSVSLDHVASELFYEDYPEAFVDREYDAWCSG